MLRLVKVCPEYESAFRAAFPEYMKDTAPFGVAGMRQTVQDIETNGFDAWLAQIQDADADRNLAPGRVGATKYWLMDGDEYVGSYTLRHDLTDGLMQWSGHVGYIIRPSRRGHGHAFAGLEMLLRAAHERGMARVLITCNVNNTASFALINRVKNTYGGEQLPDSTVDDNTYHRVWVNTGK